MSDTRDTIARIYAKLLAVDYQEQLFSDLPDKKKEGPDTKAGCPFCHGQNFSYAFKEPVWRCWNCEKGGDWIAYLMDRQKLSFPEALQELAQAAGIELDGLQTDGKEHQAYLRKASLLEAAQGLLKQALWEPAGRPVLQYLLDRGYTEEDVRAMEAGAYPDPGALEKALLKQGYSEEALRESGLLSGNLRMTLKILEEESSLMAFSVPAWPASSASRARISSFVPLASSSSSWRGGLKARPVIRPAGSLAGIARRGIFSFSRIVRVVRIPPDRRPDSWRASSEYPILSNSCWRTAGALYEPASIALTSSSV